MRFEVGIVYARCVGGSHVSRFVRSFVAAWAVLALCSCIGSGGSGESSGTPVAPLTDETICGVLSNEELTSVLGFETFHLFYSHSSYKREDGVNGGVGYDYMCSLYSDGEPFSGLEIYYSTKEEIYMPADYENSYLQFDEVTSVFPDAAESAVLEGHPGEGLAWTVGHSMYLAWRYPDGYTTSARLISLTPGGPTPEQVESFHTVMAAVLDEIPVVAAGPPEFVERPDPSATASPSAK